MNFAQRISQEGTAVRKAKRHGYERRGGIGSTKLTARVCPLFSRIAAALR